MDTVTLVLACYRNPLVHQNRWSLTAPLPEGMGLVLGLANESPEVLDRAVRQTGAKAYELRDAARFCIQQWCLARGADVHRVLGVEPGAPLEQIKEHYRQLIRLFHPDRAAGRETWTEDYASRINEAWMILSRTADPSKQLASPTDPSKQPASPAADAGLTPEMVHPAVEPAPERVPPPVIRPQRQSVPATRRPWPLSRMVLIGLLLALSIGWGGFHADRLFSQQHEFRPVLAVDEPAFHPEKLATAGVAPTTNAGVFAVLLAAPDWQALEQRERQVQQQVVQARAARQQWEENRRQQIADETAMLEKTHAARARLEQQLKSEQSRVEQVETMRQEAERQSLARLQAEQARLEKLKREREQAERQHLAVFEAEHLKAERLAEELRIERQRLEKLKAEQVQAEQRRMEQEKARQALAERTQIEQQRLAQFQNEQAQAKRLAEELRVERQRLDKLKAEQPQAEQQRAEQEKLQQAQAEQRRAEQEKARQANAEQRRLEEQLKSEQARLAQARSEQAKLTQMQVERARLEQETLRQARAEQRRLEEQTKLQQARQTVATDRVAVAMAVAAPEETTLKAGEVKKLIGRYISVYQQGNLNGIMALFTANARGRVQGDYADLLSTHHVLGLRLRDMQWVYRDSSAEGAGRYELRLRQRDSGDQRRIEGRIYFTVQKRGERTLISAIDYEWPKN